ncbi:G-type lectin S-receptor-like serine/threonine-protein kinase At2g19130 isoform X1 [Silene latifolia]|uniref:G-type lectin S-receptor-like serine/threonine-protein kinase At2g19130 isoform X1 n=1 Tax=Silene latifolia TaxID=37657 RepID=UPI003D77BE2E
MNIIMSSFQAKFVGKLSVFLLVTFLCCHGDDTITANKYISGDQTIISANGSFELGFFKPGNSSDYYIGIWYKNIPVKTVVWVANRNNPVSDKYSSSLKISSHGNLALVSGESESLIWSTNLNLNTSNNNNNNSIVSILQDDGNLVLRYAKNSSQSSGNLLWESFDNPTDTFMPNSKLGLNKKTKWMSSLTSWTNLDDPTTGLFTIERDPNASQFIMLWNQSQLYWTSGLWLPDQRIFSLIPELRFLKSQLYSFDYIDNENESYITYWVVNPSFKTRLVMDISGQLKQLTWVESIQQWVLFWSQPGQQCDVYSYCGAFGYCNQTSLPYCHCLQGFDPKFTNDWNLNDYSGGCSRKTRLSCQFHGNDSSGDKFLMSPSKVLPEHPQFAPTPSLQECESTCLRNCSCTAYAYDTDGCSVWFGELLNMKQLADTDPTGKTLYIRIAATEIPTTTGNKILVLGIVMGLVIGLVLLLVLGFVTNWRQKRRLVIAAKTMETSLTRFGYRDLQLSTKNFLQKLGEGGFGSVFKGTLPDLTDIAVKKLECISFTHGEKQFRTEVSAIGNIQHVNLVRLRGFCSEGTKRLLVYEYMPNGSLNTHLFKKENSQILSWKLRYQIAIGIARGLAYLHEKCRDCIIHCDIKPENILLDSEFCAKVADFGLAKLVGREFSRVLTTIRGTRGYLAPEWISGLAITAKADVYSYGMLLFELVSGRRNASSAKFEFFPTWAMTKLAEGEDILTLLDPILEGDGEKDQVSRVCKLACWCIQDEEDHRPSMGHIVQVLEGFLDVDMPPIPRSLQVFVGNEESIMFFSELSSDQPLTEQTSYASATSSLAPGSRFIEGSISHRGFCRTFSRHCCNIHSLVGSKCFHP